MDSAKHCKKLHKILERCKTFKHPIDWKNLPNNGVYFFYEKGETWGHGGGKSRIVRVGTHREGNFISRMKSHYIDDKIIERIHRNSACPKDRSIFRKNIGRAILAKTKSDYLPVWEVDFQTPKNRLRYGDKRNIELEKNLEHRINQMLKEKFNFKVVPTGMHEAIIGGKGLEARLIGTLSHCKSCRPSNKWLGRYSPKEKIRSSGLWLEQHLDNDTLINNDWKSVKNCIK